MQQFTELTLTMLMLLGGYQDHHGPSESPVQETPVVIFNEKPAIEPFKSRRIKRSVSAPAELYSLKDLQRPIETDSVE